MDHTITITFDTFSILALLTWVAWNLTASNILLASDIAAFLSSCKSLILVLLDKFNLYVTSPVISNYFFLPENSFNTYIRWLIIIWKMERQQFNLMDFQMINDLTSYISSNYFPNCSIMCFLYCLIWLQKLHMQIENNLAV